MEHHAHKTRAQILTRAIVVWLVLICAEILHGITRAALLVPYVGESTSSQIGVLTGSIIILVIALTFVRWIGAPRQAQLLMVGAVWLVLTVAFEVLFGRFVVGLSWERLAADYNVLEGGLMPLGLLVLLLSPLIAGRLRGVV
jgi:hypothetical protein